MQELISKLAEDFLLLAKEEAREVAPELGEVLVEAIQELGITVNKETNTITISNLGKWDDPIPDEKPEGEEAPSEARKRRIRSAFKWIIKMILQNLPQIIGIIIKIIAFIFGGGGAAAAEKEEVKASA